MTANTRAINIKGAVSRSKFFASTPSSEDSGSSDENDEYTTTSLNNKKLKKDKNTINEEEEFSFLYPQTPGSLDTFDEVLSFKKDSGFDATSNPIGPDYEESKRRQSRLLLVSLLENFCLLYDSDPERNHKTFYLICKTLSAVGIIEEEYIDEMSTVRSSYQRAFKELVVQAVNSIKQEQSMKESHMITDSTNEGSTKFSENHYKHDSHSQMFKNISFEDILDLQNSRYSNDFIELKLLGKGGFANVWKAKNKLDGIDYAIKKVKLKGDKIPEEKEKIFREIKFLARLEHKNVVRYYSSWLEHSNNIKQRGDIEMSDYSNSKSYDESSMIEYGLHDDSDIFRMSFSSDDLKSEPDFSGIDFVRDDVPAAGGLQSSASINESPSTPSSDDYTESSQYSSSTSSSSSEDIAQVNMDRDWILFIQMQLCHSSLRDYLKRRDANLLAIKKDPLNAIDRHASIELFRGIAHGVAYIHSQGLIHRDLKPRNIFMGIVPENGTDQNSWVAADSSSFAVERLVPKIGDFGLVTASDDFPIDDVTNYNFLIFKDGNESFDASTQRSSASSSYGSKFIRTTGVGTITYASPEQLAKPTCTYNEKVDIYSLGIIFFELHFPFLTSHERIAVLKDLRHGILPKGFVEKFPKEAAFILWMMAEDPSKRPNAKQILDFELLAGPIDGEHAEMQHRLVQNTQRLDVMTKENELLKNKVAELEEKLKNCECGSSNST